MIDRIFVGIDGSPGAAAAVRWAADAAASLRAAVTVVAVVDTSTFAGEDLDRERSRVRAGMASDWCEPLRPLPEVSEVIVEGDPRQALSEASGDAGADLLVVGSTGTGWFPAVHLGHVGHFLATHARRPTVVVPPQAQAPALDRVVVGVDGSPGSAAAIRFTRSLVTRPEQEIVAVHVHLPRAVAGRSVPEGTWRAEAQRQSREWIEPLTTTGVDCDLVVEEGQPARVLSAITWARVAGTVVVGARGHGTIAGVHIGSVALRLLQLGEHPVIVVPPIT
jgi:nucleotide-binding universal stress UspA family protein